MPSPLDPKNDFNAPVSVTLDSFNLHQAEATLVHRALHHAGNMHDAAIFLGITTGGLKRRIIKHKIEWPVRSHDRFS